MPAHVRTPALPSPAIVHLSYGVPRAGIPSPVSFRRWVEATLAGARRRRASELSIRIVGTREGRTLNRTYRDKDYATNVLSFQLELPPGMPLLLGDIAICAPVVRREAAEQGKPPTHHWAHMTVHGVLHLLGYDHIVEAEAVRMEALETRILKGLGVPDPYQA